MGGFDSAFVHFLAEGIFAGTGDASEIAVVGDLEHDGRRVWDPGAFSRLKEGSVELIEGVFKKIDSTGKVPQPVDDLF
ncbi:hypothetical protein GCM10011511_37660 [Puia dinghuensis]|uniref:Uncharacterized protein n=1 Tax=Puia dinghuensis TaxID=1792502 RepID=A0A8J2UG06_9BACT|nr:hypothetical protein GCM10011511_37660 [Puia dinghuensis]